MMPTIRLNPYKHLVDFDDWRLEHLVLFFCHHFEKLTRLRTVLGATLDREGARASIAVAARILPSLHQCNPSFPVDVILGEVASADCGRALRAVVPYIGTVVRLEKEGDFGSIQMSSQDHRHGTILPLSLSLFSSCPFCLRDKEGPARGVVGDKMMY